MFGNGFRLQPDFRASAGKQTGEQNIRTTVKLELECEELNKGLDK